MLTITAVILSTVLSVKPVVYAPESSVSFGAKTVCLDYGTFQKTVAAVTDRNLLDSAVRAQDSLIVSLGKSNKILTSEIAAKDSINDLCESQRSTQSFVTKVVRDSAKVARKREFWSGFSWGAGITAVVETALGVYLLIVSH